VSHTKAAYLNRSYEVGDGLILYKIDSLGNNNKLLNTEMLKTEVKGNKGHTLG
jgi:hypothetical protein